MKQCPYCAEMIQDQAVVCRYCGHLLNDVEGKKYKKCPFCAELISVLAPKCEFCGHPMPRGDTNQVPVQLSSSPTPEQDIPGRDPPWAMSIVFAFFLLIATYGIGLFIASNWTGTYSSLESFAGAFQASVIFLIAALAAKGKYPYRKGVGKYIVLTFLAMVPIINWLVIFWAGKGLARIIYNPSRGSPPTSKNNDGYQ